VSTQTSDAAPDVDADRKAHASKPRDSRGSLREAALQSAIRKRAAGVPTYSIAESAALLSISPEYLYRLIHAGGFPTVRMRIGRKQGRYVIPAKAVEQLLDAARQTGGCVDIEDWAATYEADNLAGQQSPPDHRPPDGGDSARNSWDRPRSGANQSGAGSPISHQSERENSSMTDRSVSRRAGRGSVGGAR
jgi:excisionase family DNA binding protein